MRSIIGEPHVVGGHFPYVESVVLDEDVGPSPAGVHTMVRVTHAGVLAVCDPDGYEGVALDCLSLMKALRMAFPRTFAEVNEARTPAYMMFQHELTQRINDSTPLDPVE